MSELTREISIFYLHETNSINLIQLAKSVGAPPHPPSSPIISFRNPRQPIEPVPARALRLLPWPTQGPLYLTIMFATIPQVVHNLASLSSEFF